MMGIIQLFSGTEADIQTLSSLANFIACMSDFLRWYFGSPNGPRTIFSTIVWWEKRRVPFNAIIGIYGIVSLIIFFFAIKSTGKLHPGEDAIEPIALLAAPFLINVLYTLGSITETESVPEK